MKITFLVVSLIISFSLLGQNYSNFVCKNFVFVDTLTVDSNCVVEPQSIEVYHKNQKVEKKNWHLVENNTIIFVDCHFDTVLICYRKIEILKEFKTFDTTLLINYVNDKTNYSVEKQQLVDNDLVSKGYLMRGIAVGSNQNAVLTNKMNIEIEGKINETYGVRAKAYDYNMPVDNNSATFSVDELNNVSFELFSTQNRIAVGDLEAHTDTELLKYQKQFKGVSYKHKDSLIWTNNYIGIAKGLSAKQVIKPQNGVQGPYQLYGKNGEIYIYVLQSSVVVLVDGVKMVENSDYTIDYANAQITFTNKNLITLHSRIEVYFEYALRYNSKYIVASSNRFLLNRTKLGLNVFSENDLQTNSDVISDTAMNVIQKVGDKIDEAKLLNYRKSQFDNKKILYKLIDTVVDNKNIIIFRYSNDTNDTLYEVSFMFVGENKGSYEVARETINGRIYRYVGQDKGHFEPYTKLSVPQKLQNVSVCLEHKLKNTDIKVDLAVSNNDLNKMSDLDDDDNLGTALNINIENCVVSKDSNKTQKMGVSFVNIDQNYVSSIELFNGEFYRYWNLPVGFLPVQLFTLNYTQKSIKHEFKSKLEMYRSKTIGYRGFRPQIGYFYKGSGIGVEIFSQTLISRDTQKNSVFQTSFAKTNYNLGKNWLEIFYQSEINILKKIMDRSLSNSSFMFHSAGFTVKNIDTLSFSRILQFIHRRDYGADSANFVRQSTSNIFAIQLKLSKNKVNGFFEAKYNIFSSKTNGDSLKNSDKLLLHIYSNFELLNTVANINLDISTTSINEPLMQFVYAEVEPGKGQYVWNDYNSDNQQQADEFEIAQFADQARFVRIPVNSNKFSNVYQNKLQVAFVVLPENFFKSTRSRNFFGRINNTTTITLKNHNKAVLNFWSEAKSYSFASILNSLRFVATKKLMIVNNFQYLDNQQVTFFGKDINVNRQNSTEIVWNINEKIVFAFNNGVSNTKTLSDYSLNRDFEFRKFENGLKMNFVTEDWSSTTFLKNVNSHSLSGIEKSVSYEIGVENKFDKLEKSEIIFGLSYIYNKFVGNTNSSLAYSILEGLSAGNNYKAKIEISYDLSKIFRLNAIYNFRFSEGSKSVHTLNFNVIGSF